jgi:hypothetical protein
LRKQAYDKTCESRGSSGDVRRSIEIKRLNFPVGYRFLVDEWLPDGLKKKRAAYRELFQ